MKAVVLVGGYGTRMYPLSFSTPKALLPIANRPFVDLVIELLHTHGISEVVLSMYHMPNHLREYIDSIADTIQVKVQFSIEPLPLGSGGALVFNRKHIDGTFLLLNGDILTNLPINDLLHFHKSKGALITATLSEVDDPRHWGIVEMDGNDRALSWQEKPSPEDARSTWGNVGVWVVEPEVLDAIPSDRFVSLEKEIFPKLIAANQPFYGYKYRGYWKDIGTPDKYHQANRDVLLSNLFSNIITNQQVEKDLWVGPDTSISKSAVFAGPVVVGAGSSIGENVLIQGPVVIGNKCTIASGCKISDSILWDQVTLGHDVQATGAIIGERSSIGDKCQISSGVVISTDCQIAEALHLPEYTKIGPGSTLPKL